LEKGYEFLVDTREKPAFRKKVERIVGKQDVKWRLTTLDADLVLRRVRPTPTEDIVGFERKAIADLVGSVQSGRIFKQISRMKKIFQINYLVISGNKNEYESQLRFARKNLRINWNAIHGALASFTVKERINVLWFPDDTTLIDVVYRISTKISEGKYSAAREMSPKYERFNPQNSLIVVPGINATMATRLLKHFGSMRGICLATTEDLQSVEGIGPTIAKELHDFLGRSD